ncbi:MAG: Solitary outer membrane autotransporter beta-barrel domain, partial [Psychromonas sp.]
LMRHENNFDYNTPESEQYRDQLDGEYFNLESNAFLVEPNFRFTYDNQQAWGNWIFSSDYNYFYGWTFAGADSSKGAHPEGWEIANTLKTHFTLYDARYHAESLYVKAERVDIGGDIKPSLETSHYYEFGIGLLLNTAKFTSWVDNVGIGVNVNVGSNLSGGSNVIYFNEKQDKKGRFLSPLFLLMFIY